MRRGIGAIFTTGVALVGATFVVANPVSAPSSDVRVPAVKLSSGSTASRAALDQALLEAIARDPAQSGPADLFKRSIAGAVTSVTLLSGRAVEGALRTRPVVEGTPARMPASPPAAVAEMLGGKRVNYPASDVAVAPAYGPALQRAVTSVGDYVGYVSVQAVEATGLAGSIAAEPKRITDTLAALTRGDVDSAITTALRAAAAPVRPPSTVVTAIRTEVRKELVELRDRLRQTVLTPPKAVRVTLPTRPARVTSLRDILGLRRGSAVTTKPAASSADPTEQSDQPDSNVTKPTAVNGATDLTDGNKAVPNKKAPHAQIRQRAEASLNQAGDSLTRLGDALRRVVTPPKPPRSAKPPKADRSSQQP